MTSLETLDLSGNELDDIPSNAFADLKNLRHLDLSHNRFTDLPVDVFDGLNKLQVLNLTGNPGRPFDVNVGICGYPTRVQAILN